MSNLAQQQARRQQRVEELCAASIRALSGKPDLHFRGKVLYQGERSLPMHAPHHRIDTATASFTDCRAAADGMALRLMYSNAKLHQMHCPQKPIARLVFELLEQLRVEALVPAHLTGIATNVEERFVRWSQDFHRSGHTENSSGILLYTVAQMCWSRLNACQVLEETEDFIESTRFSLASSMGASLSGLRRTRHQQAAFIPHALAIAELVDGIIEAQRAEQDADEDQGQDQDQDAQSSFALLLDFDQDGDDSDGFATARSGASRAYGENQQGYQVYSNAYDREVKASNLVRAAQLEEYRERLDKGISEQGINIQRLARQLTATLARPQSDGWSYGEEEGRIDGRRLAQLVSSPTERRLFYQERQRPVADCVVSILIDCSGSMRHQIEPIAMLADCLIRALDMIGASSELLGFTTNTWNGGKPHKEWMRQGRPPYPGRLNETCHLVFKEANCGWRRSRRDIAALLKGDLFREGVDGEALDWACNRLLTCSENRKILIVISDGSPADSATNLTNDAYYLDNHLKEVLARRERQNEVDIFGLGVGLDLSPFYRHCLATDMSQALDSHLFDEIVRLIGHQKRR
ncbi:cobaltochelatase CobT-related protein [Oceanisphaera pacifica]|uniref:Cobalamin biosynthesis protein CobT n=1 Tax=Oceanisphaera pacifica TaxID=2818389 RepID=A0ABS3NEQ0_9GAMM|nr:cobalamin biosynthesis protein CobT [Oceanisphaera pacifica]MBO1518982.1 cobalamin biosynthesis protein CobT [Oceanisphaera pacifica]